MAYTTINKGSSYFNTKLYAGTSATNSVTGVGFQPDWVWIKDRDRVTYHFLFDVVRGVTKWMPTNAANPEATFVNTLQSFNSDGFTLGSDGDVNGSPYNFVSWNWLGANTTTSNTSGSITSTVSANTTSGFSIVSWTGTGSNSDQTLGTGLSTALDFIIAKPRDSGGGTDQWLVYVNGVTDAQNNCLLLNSTAALTTGAASGTPNRGSTAGQLKLYAGTSTNQNLNASGLKYIAYCFHSVKGFSKFGKYTGNGSTDGPFVYTGFKPAWLMVKRTDSGAESWYMTDNKRGTYNLITPYLTANESNAEGTANMQDYLSNGFKIRGSGSYENASGGTYVYMAFADSPFVSSKGIPTTAR